MNILSIKEAIKLSQLDSIPNFQEWKSIRALESQIDETNLGQTEWEKILNDVAKENGFKNYGKAFSALSLIQTKPNQILTARAKKVLQDAKSRYEFQNNAKKKNAEKNKPTK